MYVMDICLFLSYKKKKIKCIFIHNNDNHTCAYDNFFDDNNMYIVMTTDENSVCSQ